MIYLFTANLSKFSVKITTKVATITATANSKEH